MTDPIVLKFDMQLKARQRGSFHEPGVEGFARAHLPYTCPENNTYAISRQKLG